MKEFILSLNLPGGIKNALRIAILGALVVALLVPAAARATSYSVRDEFSAQAYTNNNGSAAWASAWTETNDDGSATGGNVRVINNTLRLSSRAATNDADQESIQRSVNLAGVVSGSAILSFTLTPAALEADDTIILSVYNGTSWTAIATLPGTTTGSLYYDISSYANAGSAIRFAIGAGYTVTDEIAYIDNVNISYLTASSHLTNSVLQTVQTYYIPISEDQVLTSLDTINAAANSPTAVYVSMSIIADGTVIYFDHWEDDFETLINDPQQPSSEVWGDDNPANGMPPGYTSDFLHAGDIITLHNFVPTAALTYLDFDGGDKIASTEAIAVTRTGWASGSGTLHGGSVEMLDTSIWGTRFVFPVDAVVQANDFDYAGLAVMASQDGTQIYRNSAYVATINEGQSYLFNDGAITRADVVTSTAPLQANLLTGNIDSNYESSWFTLYAYDLLGSSYYAPVNSEGGVTTAVFLNNPGASQITVNWETTAGAQTSLTIPAGQTVQQDMPTTATGAHFYTSDGSHFQALSVINSGGQANDWGYTLIPANQLTQQSMVGWGVGRDPTSPTNPAENGSPVWVMAIGSGTMNVCADYDGDGAGGLVDGNGYPYDQLISLSNLQRAKIYDTDGDQTGMLVYLCNGSEADKNNSLAVAWGQDPATASAGAPGLDVGTSVPPLPNFTAIKGAELTNDINGDGQFDAGETFEYQIRINNTGALPVPADTITVKDIIPANTSYVPNSTRLDLAAIPDDVAGTPFPLDGAGLLIGKVLPIEGRFTVSFRVQIGAGLPPGTTIQNKATISGLDLAYAPKVDIKIAPPEKIGDLIWLDLDADGLADAGEPGLPGVKVILSDGICDPATTCPYKVTGANGQYTFSGLSEGIAYTVLVDATTLPSGLTQSGDPDGGCPGGLACDGQHTVTLTAANKPYWNADFGYIGPASIGDLVWQDASYNGVQDAGESGLDGVVVNLTWAGKDNDLVTTADNLSFSLLTANGGQYLLSNLPTGLYQVDLDESSLPAGFATTTPGLLSLTAVAGFNNADFGAAPGASFGDFIWNDIDGDAVQDAGEAGIGDVQVWIDLDDDGVLDAGERSATTNASGYYSFSGLPAGTYIVRTQGSPITGATATYDLDGLATLNRASVTLLGGQARGDVDFGYQYPALSISKVSSAGGTVLPGGSIQYTLQVRNNTTVNHTGIVVSDPLPAGTTYVAQSTTVTGYGVTSAAYLDQFGTAAYNNTNGTASWSSSWTEGGLESTNYPGNSPTGGLIQISTGGLRFAANGLTYTNGSEYTIARATNLAGAASATLSFSWREAGTLETNDTAYVEVYDGSTWNTVLTQGGNYAGNSGTTSLDISAWANANTQVRVRVINFNGSGESFVVDNVQVAFTNVAAQTKDNLPGGTNPDLSDGVPGALVTAADGFGLLPGQVMTVQFNVTVNSPNSLASIDNTASVTSAQQTTARTASTSDKIPAANAAIGDFVWLDVDGDGVQDSGEPGLPNVQVSLYNSGGSLVATTYTGSDGRYLFPRLLPGDYTVTVTGGVPAGLALAPGSSNPLTLAVSSNQTNQQADFGFTIADPAAAIIGDLVWSDSNDNGQQDPGEPGLAGIEMALVSGPGPDQRYGTSDDVIAATTVTGLDGRYSFTSVTPGKWVVVANLGPDLLPGTADDELSGYTPTYGPASPGGNASLPFSLAPGAVYLEADFGYSAPAAQDNTVGDFVWYDANRNALADGEAGIASVGVALIRDANADGAWDPDGLDNTPGTSDDEVILATDDTDATGRYAFTGVPDGTYIVLLADPYGRVQDMLPTFDPDESGLCVTCDHLSPVALDPAGANSSPVSVAGRDFGFSFSGLIGDRVWSDSDGDGLQDPGEPGIGGATVQLWRDADNNSIFNNLVDTLVASTTSGADGSYRFADLAAGVYFVSVADTQAVLNGYSRTITDQETGAYAAGTQIEVNLNTTRSSLVADFGYRNANRYFIGDLAWVDADADGVRDAGEAGLADVAIHLWKDANQNGQLDPGDVRMASTLSASDGSYAFTGLPDGKYLLEIPGGQSTLNGYDLTAGLNTWPVTVNGASRSDLDFGFARSPQMASIGDLVWYDANQDGQQDVTEPGLANVLLNLYQDSNHNGSLDVGTDTLLATTATTPGGAYRFDHLPAGVYFVQTDASNFNAGGALAGLSSVTGMDTAGPLPVAAGEAYRQADLGYRPAAGFSIGDFIWSDANQDGRQDPGEPGIAGVSLELLDSSNSVVATAVTRPDGHYLFSGLAAGSYKVRLAEANFQVGGVLDGYISSVGLHSFDALMPPSVPVSAQESSVLSADYGLYHPNLGSIGDRVWLDRDLQGDQDADEPGLQGVTVSLVWDLDGDGANDAGEPVIAWQKTAADGLYHFDGLRLDDGDGDFDYLVVVSDLEGILQGMSPTSGSSNPRPVALSASQPQVTDADFGYDDPIVGDRVWHDRNGNGLQDSDESGIEQVLVLLYHDRDLDGLIDAGQDDLLQTTVTDAQGQYVFGGLPFSSFIIKLADSNFQADGVLSGFTPAPANQGGDDTVDSDGSADHVISVTPLQVKDFSLDFGFQAGGPAYSIGDRLWLDANRNGYRNATETGLPGVTLVVRRDLNNNGALDADDPIIGRTVTDADGQYTFTGLPAGRYIVQVTDEDSQLVDMTWVDGAQDGTTDYSQLPIYAIQIVDASIDYADSGYYHPLNDPTSVILGFFGASGEADQVRLNWETAQELDIIGFNLYRSTSAAGERSKLNADLLPALGPGSVGVPYAYFDTDVLFGVKYYYWLEVVDVDGSTFFALGPVMLLRSAFLPVVQK